MNVQFIGRDMTTSTIAYILGVLGGSTGFISAIIDSILLDPVSSALLVFVSLAFLWSGVLIESFEESRSSGCSS